MTALALFLVLASAFIHASWNFLAKRTGEGVAFVWLFCFLSTLIYAPLALVVLIWQRPELSLVQSASVLLVTLHLRGKLALSLVQLWELDC